MEAASTISNAFEGKPCFHAFYVFLKNIQLRSYFYNQIRDLCGKRSRVTVTEDRFELSDLTIFNVKIGAAVLPLAKGDAATLIIESLFYCDLTDCSELSSAYLFNFVVVTNFRGKKTSIFVLS